MKRLRLLPAIAALTFLAVGCDEPETSKEPEPSRGQGEMGMMRGWGMMGMSMARHRYVMHHGLDPAYASKENPLAPTPENLRRGRRLYEQHCASCHGDTGRGDGPAGEHLEPPPANLAAFAGMPTATDPYL